MKGFCYQLEGGGSTKGEGVLKAVTRILIRQGRIEIETFQFPKPIAIFVFLTVLAVKAS